MNKVLKSIGLVMGLSIVSVMSALTSAGAQGIQEENATIWSAMPERLVYSSGVGAWANELSIHSDGSFSGQFWDSDMGDAGEGYPNGTMYLCNYTGQFEVPSVVSDTVYVTKLMYVEPEKASNTEEYEDGIRYCYTGAIGLDDGDDFYLYLPGTSLSDLPESALHTPRWAFEKDVEEIPYGECILYNESEDVCFVGVSFNYENVPLPEEYDILKDLPDSFTFASGAGAWGNSLSLFSDATFFGTYHDSEMGSTGEGYPHGSVYLCNYSGSVTPPVKITDTVYTMDVCDYTTEDEPGTEKIIDQIRYIYSEPYGLEHAKTLFLYLPGTPYSAMPDAARNSCMWSREDGMNALSYNQYVIYNATEDLCFFGIKEDYDDYNDYNYICEYVLPLSSFYEYTREEINQLTLQEVNYAKNEIYAIHHRQFKSQELRDFFGSKSWYQGTISGSDFSDSVFNSYERANIKLLAERETQLAGPDGYQLDQPGYNIYAARLGYLDGYDQNNHTDNEVAVG